MDDMVTDPNAFFFSPFMVFFLRLYFVRRLVDLHSCTKGCLRKVNGSDLFLAPIRSFNLLDSLRT